MDAWANILGFLIMIGYTRLSHSQCLCKYSRAAMVIFAILTLMVGLYSIEGYATGFKLPPWLSVITWAGAILIMAYAHKLHTKPKYRKR